ncbi:calcitonin gene-related peptide type 1 receptor-like isoform X2 [Ornithodoros turicata]
MCYKARFPKICLNCTREMPNSEDDCHLPDIEDRQSPLFKAFETRKIALLWVECVKKAEACCLKMISDPPSSRGTYCTRTWDGLTCFEDTKPNTNVSKVCPSILYIHSAPYCENYLTKWCHANGSWYEWNGVQRTFYASCSPRPSTYIPLYHYAIGLFSVSVAALVPALIIFNWYKTLQVPRISIHKHLCFSVMMSAAFYIIDHAVFTLDDAKAANQSKNYTKRNLWWCKAVNVFTRYFMASQYAWMVCEGFYLHRLVASAFSQQTNLIYYYGFGWGLPLILVIIYSSLRATMADIRCWRNITEYDYVFSVPIIACLLINVFFMIHVIYILVTKLRKSNLNEKSNFQKVVRAVLILLPVFGSHYILTTFVSAKSCTEYSIKQYAEWTIVGLQGFFVSLVFCYCNGEVQGLLRRSYGRVKTDHSLSRRHRPSSPNTTKNGYVLAPAK